MARVLEEAEGSMTNRNTAHSGGSPMLSKLARIDTTLLKSSNRALRSIICTIITKNIIR